MSKVLLASSVGPGKEYVFPWLSRSLSRINGISDIYVAIDGITVPDGVTWPQNAVIEPLPPYNGPSDPRRFGRIAVARESARAYFLAGDWTHLLFVDADTILPADAVDSLVSLNAHVASGISLVRDYNVPQTSARADVGLLLYDGPTFTIEYSGMGSMLIDRETLTRVAFRPSEFFSADSPNGEDFQWCEDSGVPIIVTSAVNCWHVSADGNANRLTIGPKENTVVYHGSPQMVTNRYGMWTDGVARGGLTAEEIATLGPDFTQRLGRVVGVEWRKVADLV